MVVVLSALFIFGVVALIRKPLSRWNALPLLAGAWPLLLGVTAILMSQLDLRNEVVLGIAIAGLVIMTFALVLLGYVLQSDARQEQPAFA